MAEPATNPDIATRVKIIWGLYILTVVAGVTGLIGVVLAYVWRGADRADPLSSHFAKQIRVFWITLAISIAGLVLTVVGVGFLLLFAAGVYIVVMGVIGLVKVFDGKPWD